MSSDWDDWEELQHARARIRDLERELAEARKGESAALADATWNKEQLTRSEREMDERELDLAAMRKDLTRSEARCRELSRRLRAFIYTVPRCGEFDCDEPATHVLGADSLQFACDSHGGNWPIVRWANAVREARAALATDGGETGPGDEK